MAIPDECTIAWHGNPLPPNYKHWVDYICLVNGELAVVFRNGDCALFTGTTVADYNRIVASNSPGHYVNLFLKGRPYRKIANPCGKIGV